jgi:hypothetical protein
VDGICAEVEACAADADCPEGEQCYDSKCHPDAPCDRDSECPHNQVCSTLTGQCVVPSTCMNDLGCRFGAVCIAGLCVSFPRCSAEDECPQGDYCRDGVCTLIPSCRTDAECPRGERCDYGYCQPASCASPNDCNHKWTCAGGICWPPLLCSYPEDCPVEGMECVTHVCTTPDGCSSDDDCAHGDLCLAGTCIYFPADCGFDADCQPGMVCNFGHCEPEPICQVDGDCPEDLRCIGGQCAPPQAQCAQDEHCPRGYRCDGGKCMIKTKCDTDDDCQIDFRCSNGLCVFAGPCAGPTDCPAGFECLSSRCDPEKTCASDTDCPGGACRNGRCGPEAKCAGDDECPKGDYCNQIDLKCVKLPACDGPGCSAPPHGPGPFAVGVATVTLYDESRQRTLVTEIWYPADDSARTMPHEMIDLGGYIDPLDTGAVRDAAPRTDQDPFPAIVYSHGGRGWRLQFFSFCVRLASHGFVVAAPDHEGDTYMDVGEEPDFNTITVARVKDVRFILDELDAMSKDPADRLHAKVDANHAGASGLCYGGATALLALTTENRLLTASGHAPAMINTVKPEYFAYVPVPAQLIGGEVDPNPSVADMLYAFEHLKVPTNLVELMRAGHISASNICDLDPYNVEACGADFMSPKRAQELTMLFATAQFGSVIKNDPVAGAYLQPSYAAGIPDVLFWKKQ